MIITVFPRFTHCLVIALSTAACVKQLPPAPMPAPVVPPIQAAPPAAGQARLIIDVVEGPTPVKRVRMESTQVTTSQGRPSFRFSEATELLCPTSPCVTDVPESNVLLGFPVLGDSNAMETELVHVGPDPTVYRRSLSIYDDNTGAERVLGIIATSVGGAAAITGTALLPIGLAKDNTGLATAGGISLGAGALLVTIGILMIRHDAPTYRPGNANHYPLAGR
jgi:hypothetical protein